MVFLKQLVFILLVFLVSSFSQSLYAVPMPTTDLSDVPSSSFAGEEFCFDVNVANSGDVGFGPYLQIQLPTGTTFSSSTFLGSPVTTQEVGTFPPDLIDPLTDATVTGPDGNSLIVIQPPIGSIVSGGPDLIINVCVNIDANAIIGDPLEITATPIFQLGDSATGTNGPVSGPTQTASVTPALVDFEKRLIAPEGERPPGPSWPVTYELVADIANGNSITSLEFKDVLPPQLQYVAGSIAVTGSGGGSCVANVSGSNIEVDCPSGTGTTADEDIVITYQAFVTDVLDETACSSDTIINTATFDAQRFDSVTSSNIPIAQITSQETLTTSNVEMQKSVSPGVAPNFVSPGDTLTYTVNIQTTEYGTVNSLVFDDLLPDGLENFQAVSVTGPSGALAVTPSVTPNTDGTISVNYDLHAISGDLPAASLVTIVYTADIAQSFTTPNTPVKANDFLTNTAEITYGLSEGATNCKDGSSATAIINPLTLTKEIINPQTEYQPGEVVTFRLTMEIPSGDTSNIVFDDFFPLPVFDVTTLNLTYGVDIRRASNDTLNLTPLVSNITIDSAANKLSILWPDVTSTGPQTLAVDIDIKVGTEPFSDNLSLSNLFQASTNNTPTPAAVVDLGLVGIKVGAPVLVITKGVVSSTNPNSTIDAATVPVDSNLVDADGSDVITYEITVENIGGAPARDIIITDDLGVPANLLGGCSVLSVIDGSGTNIAFTAAATFDGTINLTNQLEKNDENPAGGGAPFSTDTAFARIACSVVQSVVPEQDILNTSSAVWASASGEPKFPAVSDDAQITVDDPEIEKSLLGSVTTFTIGDIIRYEITYTIPELTLNDVLLNDELDPGLAFVNVTNHTVTTSSGDVTTSASVFNITNNGSTLELDLGTVVNSNSDDSVTETIKVSYDVVVVNDTNVNAGTTLNNTANITSTSSNTGDVSANVITIVEPNIVVDKTVITTGPYDAGDVVTYDWHIRQVGSNLTTAYDVVLEDILPTGVDYILGSLALISGSCANLITDDLDPLILKATAISFAATDDCHYQYRVTLDSTVSPVDGTDDIENTVAITWTSQPGTLATVTTPISIYNNDSCERTSATDPNACGSGNDYDEESTASIDIRDVVVQKLNNTTSELTTGIAEDRPRTTDLAIGETATYTIIVTIPEGTSQNIRVTDNFPANANAVMEFLPADTVVTIGSDLMVTNDLSGIGTGVATDSRLSDGILDRGRWDFGQVINSAIDGVDLDGDNAERIIIEVTGRIVDNPTNVSLKSSSNTAVINFGTGLRDTSRIGLDVVEPLLEIDKSSTTTTADGGDSVTFSIKVKHTAASTQEAFDLVVNDVIPAGLVYVPGSLAEVISPTCTVSATLDEGLLGAVITASYDNLPKADECELTFNATIASNVSPNQQITNTADLTWDSLIADDDPEERDYSANDNHQITVSSPGLSKIVSATSETSTGIAVNGPEDDLTIGERVTYQFTATIPEGQSDSVVITDQLPNTGVVLRLVSSRIVTIGTQLTLIPAVGSAGDDCLSLTGNNCDSNSDGERDLAQWDIGIIANAPDGVSDANDQIVFEVIAVVADVVANTGTDDDVVNTATFTFGGGQMVSGTALVDIVEPLLTIDKQVTAPVNPLLVDAGDIITFEITVAHDAGSNADAFNLEVVDTLANNGTDVLMNWVGNVGGTCGITTANIDEASATPFEVVFDLVSFDVASGSCTITYQVEVDDLVTPAQTLQNSAALAYDSTPNFVAGETRSSTENVTAEVVVTAPSMMVKTIVSTSLGDTGQSQHDVNLEDLAVGELVTYSISMKFPEGTTPNVILRDTMPSGANGVIEIVGPPTITSAGNGITTSNLVISSNPNSFTIDFGSVLNPPNNIDNSNDFITVEVTGVVTDDAVNIDGAQPVNSATFSYSDGTGTVVELTDTAIVDIVEPDMDITKSMTVSDGLATISVSLMNKITATASAYDIRIEDVLDIADWDTNAITPTNTPTGFTLTTVAGPNPTETTVVMANDPASSSPINSIEPNETVIFVFTVPVQPGISSISNTATNTSSTSTPGDNANEREEDDIFATTELLIPLIELEKTAATLLDTDGDGEVGGVDDKVIYNFKVTNTGGVPLTNVTVIDTNPAVTVLGGPISLAVGADDSTTITGEYIITQDDMNLGSIENTASVSADGPTGTGSTSDVSDDPNDADNTDINGDGESDGPTVIPLTQNPKIAILKTASISDTGTGLLNEIITYTFTISNEGNVPLTDILINDSRINVVDLSVPDIAVGAASQSITAQYTILQDDINDGSISNQAIANADSPAGPTTDNSDDDSILEDEPTVIPLTQTPGIAIVKTVAIDAGGTGAFNDTLTYTFVVTNKGNVPLTSITIADSRIGISSLAVPDIAVNGSQTVTASYTINQTDLDDGNISNQAIVTGTSPSGSTVSDLSDDISTAEDGTTDLALNQNPLIAIIKTASALTDDNGDGVIGGVNDLINYVFTVTNTGNVTLDTISVTDPKVSNISCLDDTLLPGIITICKGDSYTITQDDINTGSVTNQATVNAEDPDDNPITDQSDDNTNTENEPTVTSVPQTGSIGLIKTAEVSGTGVLDDVITYTFRVQNTGTVTLINPVVNDALTESVNLVVTPSTLLPNAIGSATATYAIKQIDIDAGRVLNQASVTAADLSGSNVSDNSDDNSNSEDDPTIFPLDTNPSITLIKTGVVNGTGAVDDTITYTLTVQNTGDVTLSDVVVNDALTGSVDVPVAPATLGPGESGTATLTYTIKLENLDAGEVINSATVSGTPPPFPDGTPSSVVNDTSDDDSPTEDEPTQIPLNQTPGVAIVKTTSALVDNNGDLEIGGVDDEINYVFTVTNTGDVTINSIVVTDPKVSNITCLLDTLAPGVITTCTGDAYIIDQDDIDIGFVSNQATVEAKDPSGGDIVDLSDSSSNTDDNPTVTSVPQIGSIAIVKTGVASGNGGKDDVITYTLTVTNTGTVTLRDIVVNDALTGTVNLPVSPSTLLPGEVGTAQATYTIKQVDVDAGQVLNQASVSGTGPIPNNEIVNDTSDDNSVTENDPTVIPLATNPSIALVKTSTIAGGSQVGDIVTYTFTVVNTGDMTLYNVMVNDPLISNTGFIVTPTVLGPGESGLVQMTYAITQYNINLGEVSNTATVSAIAPNLPNGNPRPPVTDTSDDGSTASGEDDPTITPLIQTPEISVVKTASVAGTGALNDIITYSFEVKNEGNIPLTNVSVTDSRIGVTNLAVPDLSVGENAIVTADYAIQQTDLNAGSINNQAIVNASSAAGVISDNSDDNTASENQPTITFLTQNPAITVLKTSDTLVDTDGDGIVGGVDDVITYTFVVRNTGNVTLSNIIINDTNAVMDGGPILSLLPGAFDNTTFSATHIILQNEFDDKMVVNQATVEATAPNNSLITNTSDDPTVGSGVNDPTVTTIPMVQIRDIPTLSEWMLMLLSLLLLIVGLHSQKRFIKRHPPTL